MKTTQKFSQKQLQHFTEKVLTGTRESQERTQHPLRDLSIYITVKFRWQGMKIGNRTRLGLVTYSQRN